jgi:hypothetical protein
VEKHFGRHLYAEIHRSQPGIGAVLGARALAELGDDPHRHADGRSRQNYAATSPITRASGKKKIAAGRFACNDRLIDALNAQAFSALRTSPGARLLRGGPRARFTVANAECGIDRNVRVDPMISRVDQHLAAPNGRVDRLLTHA